MVDIKNITFLRRDPGPIHAILIQVDGKPVGEIDSPPDALIELFLRENPLLKMTEPEIRIMAKLYPLSETSEYEKEIKAWKTILKSRYFAFVPIVVDCPYQVQIGGNDTLYNCLLMEWAARGKKLREWFTGICNTGTAPIVFHQFFTAWFQIFEVLNYLHSEVYMYHGDVKPDNLLFNNSALKFIDFNLVKTKNPANVSGTPQYAPNCVLKPRQHGEKVTIFRSDYFDLFCAGMMLLEVFTGIGIKNSTTNKILVDLEYCFENKRNLLTEEIKEILKKQQRNEAEDKLKSEYYRNLAKQNENIKELVAKWETDSNSIIASCFKKLLDENMMDPANTGNSKDLYDFILQHKKQKYIERALQDIKFNEPVTSLLKHKSREETMMDNEEDPSDILSMLLTNYSRNIFSFSYPLQYLYYSYQIKGYDVQAKKALDFYKELMPNYKVNSCLDMGCAFGTAALVAAEHDIRNISCLDNNPYFAKLCNILWYNEAWNRLKSQYPEDVLNCVFALYGPDTEERLKKMVGEYNQRFLNIDSTKWRYLNFDYWALSDLDQPRPKYDLIICNNFLHWPVIDFLHMNEECSNKYIRQMDSLIEKPEKLLFPLKNFLKDPGCIVIVEPSLFFKDDVEDDTEHWEKRFSNKKFYQIANNKGREVLSQIFDIPIPPKEFKRQISFYRSKLERCYIGRNNQDKKVIVKKDVHKSEGKWPEIILGEFPMTLLDLPDETLRKFGSDPNKLKRFNEEFRNYLETKMVPEKDDPIETIFLIGVIKSSSTHPKQTSQPKSS